MKHQCNFCGIRIDTVESAQNNNTWCPVFDKKMENESRGCEHWQPDAQNTQHDRILIANNIKSLMQAKTDSQKLEKKTKQSLRIAIIALIISFLNALPNLIPWFSSLINTVKRQ